MRIACSEEVRNTKLEVRRSRAKGESKMRVACSEEVRNTKLEVRNTKLEIRSMQY